MGVNVKRAGLVALVAAAVLLPLRKERQAPVDGGADSTTDRLFELMYKARLASYWWEGFSQRDSAIAAASRMTASDTLPKVTLQGFPDGTPDNKPTGVVNAIWKRIGIINPSFRGAVLIYNQHSYHSGNYGGAYISRDGATTRCVASAPASVTADHHFFLRNDLLDAALAPCALLAAFGPPGNAVGSWLRATHFDAAQSNNWLTRPPDFSERDGPVGRPGISVSDRRDNFLLFRTFGELLSGAIVTVPYEYGATGLRCMNGHEASCAAAVLHPDLAPADSSPEAASITMPPWIDGPGRPTLGTVHPPALTFLSSIIAHFGREKFRRFWTSNQSFEAAFQDAFGESLGHWTAGWAHDEWLSTFRAKFHAADIAIGVTLEPSWLVLLAGWSAIALLLASLVARRRTA